MNNSSHKELRHYGILGMRWGVRRSEKELARARAKTKVDIDEIDSVHDDYKKAHSSGRVHAMSDAELRARINRIQMESQYRQLTTPQKSAGQKFVSEVLTNAAKQTATKYVSKYMDDTVASILNSKSKKK